MELSTKSKQLIQFFKKKPFHSIQNTSATNRVLEQLYTQLYDSYAYIVPQTFKPSIQRSPNCTKPKLFDMGTFPQEVAWEIHQRMKIELVYSFSLDERNIKVYFVLEQLNMKRELNTYHTYAKSIAMWLMMVNQYAKKKCAKELTIYVYLTSLEKQLPSSNSIVLSEIHANTAFTTTCPVVSEIVIFRKEEWFKVFIHETFHNFDLDFSSMNCDTLQACLLHTFDVHIPDLRPYEAYTEFWACTINCMFCSFFSLKNKKNVQEFLQKSEYYMNLERVYSCFQMVKLLQFMGLTYTDLYAQTKHSTAAREKYKEKTHLFSYFVLKTIVLHNYNSFLQWCIQHNHSLLEFQKTSANLQSFCDFIVHHYKARVLLENTNHALHVLKQIRNPYILTNMRMTICELQ